MAERILLSAALRAARKKLPIASDSALRESLDWAADSKAEAYRIGAEEAQQEIVSRLARLASPSQAGGEADG